MGKKFLDIIAAIDTGSIHGDQNPAVTGIEYDSRRIKPGYIFVAVTGFQTDGKKYVAQAVENGAVAVIADAYVKTDIPVAVVPSARQAMAPLGAAFYDNPSDKLELAGTTGTNGKSTAVKLTGHILKSAGSKTGVISSLTYDTGLHEHRATRTTPEALDMQKYLYEMVQAGSTHGVIEVSSHALVLNRVDEIDFKYGLFTTFSRDHLDFHKTMEEYLRAKQKLLHKLSGKEKRAVINNDVEEFRSFVKSAQCPTVTYSSADTDSDIMVEKYKLHSDRTEFVINTPDGRIESTIKLPGRYNLTNATAAVALAFTMGVKTDTIGEALSRALPLPGRFQPLNFGQLFTILIDFAHTPDALERLCLSAREITNGRLITLFGCGGDRDKGKRPLMGQAASKNSDLVIITSDNPRTENPDEIISEIMPGIKKENYKVVPDRREAVREAIKHAKEGDMLIFAGKGAEDYQEIGTEKLPFNEAEEIRLALIELGITEGQPG